MEPKRKEPTITTLKALFAKSGNCCAFPKCDARLVDEMDVFVGQVCHIHAVKKSDARYDPSLNEQYLRSRDNLILFCYPHHKRIDAFEQDYPAEVLQAYRAEHEAGQNNYVVPEKALAEAIVNAVREDWMPNLVPVIAYLETSLSEIQHQAGMNFVSHLISNVFDVELYFELMRLLKMLPSDGQSQLVEEQEHWIEYRNRAAEGAIESHGASMAPLEHNWRYNELSLERLKDLRSRREKLS